VDLSALGARQSSAARCYCDGENDQPSTSDHWNSPYVDVIAREPAHMSASAVETKSFCPGFMIARC
jgi:hypothetical protein